MMHECPEEGCEFKSSTENGVVMHYLNKSVGHNEFERKPQVYRALSGESESNATPAEDKTPTADGGTGGTKLDLTSLAEPDDDDDEPADSCPACSHEDWFGADAVIERYGSKLSAEERNALSAAERVCAKCGEVYG